jgi:hypothetical protein
MINAFQIHQVETEHREQQESGFQRENHAWSPIANEAYSREGHALFNEHCRGGHRGRHNPGAQYLPDMQLCGQGDQTNPNPMAGPQGACQPQDSSSPASTGAEIAKLDKTIMNFTKLLQGMGGAHDRLAGAGNDAAPAGAHNALSKNAGGDQSMTPSQKSGQQANDNTPQTAKSAAAAATAGDAPTTPTQAAKNATATSDAASSPTTPATADAASTPAASATADTDWGTTGDWGAASTPATTSDAGASAQNNVVATSDDGSGGSDDSSSISV